MDKIIYLTERKIRNDYLEISIDLSFKTYLDKLTYLNNMIKNNPDLDFNVMYENVFFNKDKINET